MSFFKKVGGALKSVAGIAMEGAGSLLSVITPTGGGMVKSVGQSIGGGLKAGAKLLGNKTTADDVSAMVQSTVKRLGLDQPAPDLQTAGGRAKQFAVPTWMLAAGGGLLLLLFMKK